MVSGRHSPIYWLQLSGGERVQLPAFDDSGDTRITLPVTAPEWGRMWRALLWMQSTTAESEKWWYGTVGVPLPNDIYAGAPFVLEIEVEGASGPLFSAVVGQDKRLDGVVWQGQRGRLEKSRFDTGSALKKASRNGLLPGTTACCCVDCGTAAQIRCDQCGDFFCLEHCVATVHQLSYCLSCFDAILRRLVITAARADRLNDAVYILGQHVNNSVAVPIVQRHLGLSHAQQGMYDVALSLLEHVPIPFADTEIQTAMAQIRMQRAAQAVAENDFLQAAVEVSIAARLDPMRSHIQEAQAVLKGWHAANLVSDGAFAQAASIWEEQFHQRPTDLLQIHNLAILYYQAATTLEREFVEVRTEHPADSYWHKTIAAWATVLHSSAFWDRWQNQRAEVAGYVLKDFDRQEVIRKMIELLLRDLRDRAAEFPGRFDELERLWLFETKTAALVAACVSNEHISIWPVGFACGPMMMDLLNSTSSGARIIQALRHALPTLSHPYAEKLVCYLSPLGKQHFLLDENRLDQAIAELEIHAQGPHAQTLLGIALCRKGQELSQLSQWKRAYSCYERASKLGADLTEYAEGIIEAGIKHAKVTLDTGDKDYKQAIAVLYQVRDLVGPQDELDTNLSATYAQAARIANNRDDFEEAAHLIRLSLQFKQQDRLTLHFARVVMANYAIHIIDTDIEKAISLFKEALTYENDQELSEIFATVLYKEAVKMAQAKKRDRAVVLTSIACSSHVKCFSFLSSESMGAAAAFAGCFRAGFTLGFGIGTLRDDSSMVCCC